MRLRSTLALAAAAALTLTACGSGEPSSMKDLKMIAEKAGFDCGPESGEKGENVEATCGELGLVWYESEEAEQESYEALSSVYGGLPFEDLHNPR